MHKLYFKLICVTFLLSGCVVTPLPVSQTKKSKLTKALHNLDRNNSTKESMKLSRDIFYTVDRLTKEFKLTSPPLWHNTLVNVGLRKKGLCYHWSDTLYMHLVSQKYAHFEFHLVGANIGEYFWEHNALVVVKKGGKVQEGIVIDPWRDSGKLYFSKVNADKKYSWSHRSDRGCK